MPTALLTGILGQDGSLLAEHLLARGYRVHGVERPGARAAAAAHLGSLLERIELVELDLGAPKPESWAQALVDRVAPDEVYHLAACHHSSDPAHRDDPALQQRMVEVNLSVGLALAHALLARRAGSLVLAGSSQMYLPADPPPRVDEATPIAPATFYGVTKSACMRAVAWLRERQGLRGSCAILFNHESERRTPEFVSRKITRAAARIAAGLESSLELLDTSGRADFSSAHDVVDGLHRMATAERPADRVLASGELHTVEDLCRVAFAAVGLDWRAHVRSQRPPGTRPSLVGDPAAIERELGWRRQRSFEQWVEAMVRADQAAL